MNPFRGPPATKRILLSLSLAVLVLSAPSVVAADDKVPVSCELTLAVIDPGTLVQDGNRINTTGEKTLGELDCDLDAMDGVFSTVHSSKIEVDPYGSFTGKLKGDFSLATAGGPLSGKMKADINGEVVGYVLDEQGNPVAAIHEVTDVGEWKLTGSDVKGKGTMSVTLVGVVGLPAYMGGLATIAPGSMDGEVKIKGDKKGHHGDDDDGDDDDDERGRGRR